MTRLSVLVVILILAFLSLPLSAAPQIGENLYFDINYSGLAMGYLKVEVKGSYPLKSFFQTGIGLVQHDYFQDVLLQAPSSNSSIVWLRVNSNVSQLDKEEDIYLQEPQGFPLIFQQVSQQGTKTLTLMNPLNNQTIMFLSDGAKDKRNYQYPVFDPVSLFYYLREQDLTKPHALATIDQNFNFIKTGEETISHRGKMYQTLVVKSEPAKITFWFTNDVQRLPLKIQYDMFMGSVVFELRT